MLNVLDLENRWLCDKEVVLNQLDSFYLVYVVSACCRLTGKEKRIGGFDLIWDDGPIFRDIGGLENFHGPNTALNSFLGCDNDRKEHLRSMYRALQQMKKTGVA